MRAVIQRVSNASVSVNSEIVGQIGRGLCVLVGIHKDDKPEDVEYIIRKILNLRLFHHENKPWDKSVKDLDLEILCISQFTLYGLIKGNKLDFHNSMSSQAAAEFYATFLQTLKSAYKPEKVQDGRFGAMMQVDISNDGPVTYNLDSRQRE
ncbi:hypothetical protein WR25_10274 isoform A [Diploscapter pachys]|uniref:D-aminoacyl-tRNA deacylase n=1 Tax=Diploscapter pachys TaxID=2018661 RepID=A0A2A2JTE9_9BILA|nr:hypothetical protein WR25_10274 isoform A [Diploscapter pachys]